MSDAIDGTLDNWADVEAKKDWSSFLIGNGFSQNIWRGFSYDSLFERAANDEGPHLVPEDVALFTQIGTRNFEMVLSALATSRMVATALRQAFGHFEDRENSIREALIRAVHSVHVPWGELPNDTLDLISNEISKYSSIYYTNYDLIMYWAIMRDNTSTFRDYFFAEEFDVTNTEIWGKKTRIHYLHGGLHLYRQPNGQTLKRRAEGEFNLLDLFGRPYRNAIPLFISEGSAEEKLASIYRSDYLSFAFSHFLHDRSPLVIFGHSLGESDQHIVNAIAAHKRRSVAISIRPCNNIRRAKAAYIEKLPEAEIHFFNAETHPIGAPELLIESHLE